MLHYNSLSHLHHHPPPPPTTTTCEFNDTFSSSTSMPLVTVRPTLPQQEHHFRQRPELIKIVCGIYKSNVIHPPFPPAICRMVTTAGNGNVPLTLVVQGFRYTRAGPLQRMNLTNILGGRAPLCGSPLKKNGKNKKEELRPSITFPASPTSSSHFVVQSICFLHACPLTFVFFFCFLFLFFFLEHGRILTNPYRPLW